MPSQPPAIPADWPSAPPGNGHRPPHGRDPDFIPFDGPVDDGPTVRLHDDGPPAAAPRRRGGRAAAFAVFLAVFAMLAAGYAVWLGRQALDAASAAAPVPVAGTGGAAPTAAPTVTPSAAASAVVSAAVAPPPGEPTVLIDPSAATPAPSATAPADAAGPPAAGVVRYAGKAVPVRAGCATAVYLDLDEPRAVPAATTGSDVQTACAGRSAVLRLGPGAGGGALLRSSSAEPGASPTAATCEERLLSDPLDPVTAIPLRDGLALCVRTGAEGEPGSVVLLQAGATAADGTVTLRATSWTSD
ncbi:hypothetical protein [Spirilliplanes yamanashiensis]|uniref:Uncharacterized protein n=1 Tax=Spirilliplanes yamanashiensis TaxID=42233 RepID=A0A8J4DKB3_9ACTN|nr:hypothetical protein [Spirilliplanes yamanashiensis]MDP9818641.1 hypothetical protein [Spirilliplanes yamanashiensis]GIJ05097.1 hypothetical protein Sya03_44490 [Spirilliplanes yamanashiensis]